MALKDIAKEYPNAPWNVAWGVVLTGAVYGLVNWLGALDFWQQIALVVVVVVGLLLFTFWVAYMKKYYGLDLLGFIKDFLYGIVALINPDAHIGTDEPEVVVPPQPSGQYPAWPGVSYIVWQGMVAVYIDALSYGGPQIVGIPKGVELLYIITQYGQEKQGYFCPTDGYVYKMGSFDVFADEKQIEADKYAVLKTKVIDAFNSICPVNFKGSVIVSATGNEYAAVILPYVQSLGMTEQQFVDKYYKK